MSDDKIVSLELETKLEVPVEKVLAGAVEEHERDPFDRVLIIAMRGENCIREFYATSDPDSGVALYDMERFKRRIMWEADQRVSEG